MGFLSPTSPPPPPLLPAPTAVDDSDLTEFKLNKQKQAGSAKNVISSLKDSVSDTNTSSSISKLLG